MKATIEVEKTGLGALAGAFKSEDRRCVFLVDTTGNAYTFFKYKARLVDLSSTYLEVSIGKKDKSEAMEEIRKGLLYGIKQGEAVILHLGENQVDMNEFLKDEKFWNPKQLFRLPEKFDSEWYRANVMKPNDKDMFGNEGSFYPSD